jgi:hypothetical protein
VNDAEMQFPVTHQIFVLQSIQGPLTVQEKRKTRGGKDTWADLIRWLKQWCVRASFFFFFPLFVVFVRTPTLVLSSVGINHERTPLCGSRDLPAAYSMDRLDRAPCFYLFLLLTTTSIQATTNSSHKES